ncbi:MgtC/SapB family protein [Microlunatus speluncae]|uniref:MgtC/SapB family protein n=1 Tax=Microlunatus speluncae TaxID=2594267 RepID=UPI0012664EDF|nr:MgtC/SapB family protein [Microlunatus speluncae]
MPTDLSSSLWLAQVQLLPHLGVALILSMVIGLERQFRGKQAGVRTHALVGIGSALFMLVSKYGFSDLLGDPGIGLDPSRVAAQIVSGIGFLGAGIIVFRSDAVRGLTTAASIWLTAAVGMACGGGLFILALAVTASHFLVVFVGPRLSRLRRRTQRSELWVEYRDGAGLLRDIVAVITDHQWRIAQLRTAGHRTDPGYVGVYLTAEGRHDGAALLDAVSRVSGVRAVEWRDDDENEESA